MTLSQFLLERIAEDERDASRWLFDREQGGLISARNRVLAGCEVKREIIALDDRGYDMEPAMMYLARIWREHPDFREEWL